MSDNITVKIYSNEIFPDYEVGSATDDDFWGTAIEIPKTLLQKYETARKAYMEALDEMEEVCKPQLEKFRV